MRYNKILGYLLLTATAVIATGLVAGFHHKVWLAVDLVAVIVCILSGYQMLKGGKR